MWITSCKISIIHTAVCYVQLSNASYVVLLDQLLKIDRQVFREALNMNLKITLTGFKTSFD